MMERLFYQFAMLKSRLTHALATDHHLHTARFAYLHERASISRPSVYQTGLLLGTDTHGRALQVRARANHPELGNLGIFAPPRSGKSVHLTTQLLTWNESTIVNDPKGELFQKTAGYKKAAGHTVLVFCPTGVGNRFDPLLSKTTEDELQDGATQLLHIPNEGEGKRFTERSIHMLTQLLLAARIEQFPPFPYVREMLRLGLPGAAEHLHSVAPLLARQFLEDDFAEIKRRHFDDAFLSSCWASLSAGMRPLLTETITKSLSGCDFDPAALLTGERPVDLYLCWPERYLLTLRPLMKLLWGVLLEEVKATYDSRQGKGCRKLLCLVDEAGVTPIHELQKHIATVNARGISFILAYQAKSQIAENHGMYNAETILNSMDSKLFFRQASLETAEYVSKLLGYTSGFAHSESEHHGQTTSKGTSEREVPLLTAQQIMQLPDWHLIGFHRNLPPFRTQAVKWWTLPVLARRNAISPPAFPVLPDAPHFADTLQSSSCPPDEKTPWHHLFPHSVDPEEPIVD